MRLLTFIFIILTASLKGQVEISGTVKDAKGETIPGVNVWIKDSFDGGSTDMKVIYSFET